MALHIKSLSKAIVHKPADRTATEGAACIQYTVHYCVASEPTPYSTFKLVFPPDEYSHCHLLIG